MCVLLIHDNFIRTRFAFYFSIATLCKMLLIHIKIPFEVE